MKVMSSLEQRNKSSYEKWCLPHRVHVMINVLEKKYEVLWKDILVGNSNREVQEYQSLRNIIEVEVQWQTTLVL